MQFFTAAIAHKNITEISKKGPEDKPNKAVEEIENKQKKQQNVLLESATQQSTE